MDDAIKSVIRSLALENAVKFNGKANPGGVIGTILGKFPECKRDMASLQLEVKKIVSEVNLLSFEDQQKEFTKSGSAKEQKEQKEKRLKDLSHVDAVKGVVMRFAPSPSGPMHLGHAITGSMTSLYVQRYGGKFILRIEDTNSDNIYAPAYELLPKDAEWIFGNVSEVIIQSERMELYYEYVEKFLKLEAVYVCTCAADTFHEFSLSETDCPCRSLALSEQSIRWKKMFEQYQQGDAVVRFKSGMQQKNPALRDFPLMRINDSVHPRQGKKYRVWPLMNLSVTVDDIEYGMTHIVRAKEHQDNAKKQKMMYEVLTIPFPETLFLGRINFIGLEISCSKTKARIEQGEFEGWTDVRIPFLGALRRRGYQAQAFKRYANELGVSPVDKTVQGDEFFKTINAFNKEIIDPVSKRFFFVAHPQAIEIKNAPTMNVTMDLHPDNQKGGRTLQGSSHVIISQSDSLVEEFRLRDYCNVLFEKKEYVCSSVPYDQYQGKHIIHWLPDDSSLIKTLVIMPDNSHVEGKSESGILSLNIGDIIQFERFGFCRLDEVKDDVYYFCFAHK